MILTNKFIGYIERTAAQMKEAILAKLNTPEGIPEMTDHTESNPWIRGIAIWTAIAELFHYYIDGSAQETFLTVAEEYKSAALKAREFDYRVKGSGGATVDLLFTLNAPTTELITIPAGTECRTSDGTRFFTIEEAQIDIDGSQITVEARQEVPVVGQTIGQTTGQPLQKISIEGAIVDNSIQIIIQALEWFGQDTFAFSGATDKHFVAGMNELGLMAVEFGDGVLGEIPTGAQDVIASYRTTSGSVGNMPQKTITEIIGAIVLPNGILISVTNPGAATGGYDAEDLTRLKKRIPLSIRTLWRAVTKGDYDYILMLAPGVAKATSSYVCGKVIDAYIAPEGSTNPRAVPGRRTQPKMITTMVRVKSAGVVHTKVEFDVVILPNYVNSEKSTEGIQRITDFLNIQNQQIKGTVEIGDLYELLETMVGVKYSRMKVFTIEPYARPINMIRELFWTRSVGAGSVSTIHWKIVKNDDTHYQLVKNGSFVGTKLFDTEIVLPEITFNVASSGTYVNGDTWEFVTYKYNDNLALDEPSIPVADAIDVTLNVTGGR